MLLQPASEYRIGDLKPGINYRVLVSAVYRVDMHDYSSVPATLFFSTDLSMRGQRVDLDRAASADKCSCDLAAPRNNVLKEPVYFEKNELTAKLGIDVTSIFANLMSYPRQQPTLSRRPFTLEWAARACIENPSSSSMNVNAREGKIPLPGYMLNDYLLRPLQFQCHYEVTVYPEEEATYQTGFRRSHRARNAETPFRNVYKGCFCTPSCQEVRIKGNFRPANCPKSSESETPTPPIDLRYELQPGQASTSRRPRDPSNSADSFDATISWDIASTSLNSKLIGYRIVWGPRIYEPIEKDMYGYGINPRLDPSKTESKVITAVSFYIRCIWYYP
ncbi:Kallmann syndrome 1 sequence [Cichlidogyrus casuarinus]|uniref:Kallmann syndrome 1 sequence n=1 Tax=Cichlidogyrus casuarinus TaxID=1844966 RepID=A0ABD2QEV9_9PLAT